MDDYLFFLPGWPTEVGPLAALAGLLLAGVLAGEALRRFLSLPPLLGWVAAGMALGPHGLGLLDAGTAKALRGVIELAAGLVMFELGQRIDVRWFARNPWLAATALLEAAAAWAAVSVLLLWMDLPAPAALLAGGIAAATSPAVVMTVARDGRARGQVTDRVMLLTASGSAVALVAVSTLFAWLHAEAGSGWPVALAHPLWLVFGSLLAGWIVAALTLRVLQSVAPQAGVQALAAFAVVAVAVGVSEWLGLVSPLLLLMAGTWVRVAERDHWLPAAEFGVLGTLLLVLLFALSAAQLDPAWLWPGVILGLAVVAARQAGKVAGVLLLARPSGLSLGRGALVGIGLAPLSAASLVLLDEAGTLFPDLWRALAPAMVSAVVILELAGPLLARFALQRAGELAARS